MFCPSIVVVNCGNALSSASALAPVVARPPVLGQLLQVVERHAAAPADAGQLVGPAGAGEPIAQVVEVGLGDVDPERPDLGARAAGLTHAPAPSARLS